MGNDPANELDAMKVGLEALQGLDPEARVRAIEWIAGALGVKSPVGQRSIGSAAGPGPTTTPTTDLGTPKQFVTQKAAQSDIERVTVLAYYLTHARGLEHFKTKDLSDLNLAAAGPRLSNASYAASNADKKSGYLAAGPGGTKQITSRGEALVEALPDREAAKAAVEAIPGKPRRNRGARPKPRSTIRKELPQ